MQLLMVIFMIYVSLLINNQQVELINNEIEKKFMQDIFNTARFSKQRGLQLTSAISD